MEIRNQLVQKLQSLHLNVLLAEDEVISQLVFKNVCKNISCNVDIASDGKEALDYLKKTVYDIIFLDLHMPFFSGYDLINVIKKTDDSLNKNTPVILVSGTASKAEMEKAMKYSFDELLTKPFSPNQFYSVVNKFSSTDYSFDIDIDTPIDLSIINQLYNNEQSLIDSVVATIKQELSKHLLIMESPDFATDYNQVKDFIHKIRPSFSYLGLKKIAEQLLYLEKKLDSGTLPTNFKETCQSILQLTKRTLANLK